MGRLELKNGDIVQGNFEKGMLEGEGIHYQYSDGKMFFGDYEANRKHGNGVFEYENGIRFEGKYERDLRHGEGELKFLDGRWLKGVWNIGLKEGKFKYFDGKDIKNVEFAADVLMTKDVVIENANK